MDFGRDIDDFSADTRVGTGFYDNSSRRHVERRRRQELQYVQMLQLNFKHNQEP